MTVTDNVAAPKYLQLGIDVNATDDIDTLLGESELPPMPPAGNFEARFILPKNNFSGELSSYVDFRNGTNPFTGQKIYRLQFQKSASATAVTIKWNLPSSITGALKDIINGTLINVPVAGTGEYTVTNPTAFSKLALILDFVNTPLSADEKAALAFSPELGQNYPNPFNPSTRITYSIPKDSKVSLKVYTISMELVEVLVSGYMDAGTHTVSWQPAHLPSGVYIYALQAGNKRLAKQMIYLK
jgi:hypothetical protein